MSNFLAEQGRTRGCGEAYKSYVAAGNPADNPAVGGTQREKGHFWTDTNRGVEPLAITGYGAFDRTDSLPLQLEFA
jgi:hypothetical protein